jgi:hypothetical protein
MPLGTPPPTSDTLTNQGTINSSGSEAVSISFGGGDWIINGGTISGISGIAMESNSATENIENSGTIEGSSGAAISSIRADFTGELLPSVGISVVNSGSGLLTNAAANAKGGVKAGVLYFDDGAGTVSTIDNEATITGAGYVIQSASDLLDIANSGAIHGGLYSTATVNVDNSGLWQNSTASEGLDLFGQDNVITNEGKINAPITFTGSSDVLTNSGVISGDVTLGEGSSLRNHRRINGDVTLGADDTLVNTGVNGDVTLGGSDTITDNGGKVFGAFVESSNDLIGYAGRFGEQTIDGFGNGDILQFAANDFGSFGSVMHHTHQVGADTVIRLDAADSITLVGVAKSSLVASDFKFV